MCSRRAAREERIQTQADGQPGESLLQPLCQAVEGLEFAILLGRMLSWVLDELGQDGESKPVGQHQFGFQHRMIVGRLAVVSNRHAVGAVSLGESEPASTIDGDHEMVREQAIAIQHLFPNQGSDHIGDDGLHLVGVQSTKRLVKSVTVRIGICAKHSLKLGLGGPVVAKHMGDLPPCAQAAEIHQYTGKGQRFEGIDDEFRDTRIVNLKKFIEIAKEVMDGGQK